MTPRRPPAADAPATYAGFDLGGTRIKFGLIDASGRVAAKDSAPIPPDLPGCLRRLEEIWTDLSKAGPGPVAACGFGFAGFYSLAERKVLASPNYPALDGFDLVPALSSFIGVPFVIDNDANMAAFGEYVFGAGRGAHSLVLLTLGTGVGSGIILRGELWRGVSGFGGEFGHITVRPDGYRCSCGNIGCLETETAAPAVVRNFRQSTEAGEALTAEDIHRLALAGNAPARAAFARCGESLGIGLGIIINALNPEMILLGGGVMAAGDLIRGPAIAEAARRSHRVSFAACRIERASMGNDAGFVGAAAAARDALAKPGPAAIPSPRR